MSYHLRQIFPQGTYGELSKVYEELDEYQESLEQENKIMAVLELSDVYGALEAVANTHGYSMSDLAKMSAATKRAFDEGSRCLKETPVKNMAKCYSPINWSNISKAVDFCVENGFQYIEAPWAVSSEALAATMPFNRLSYSTRIGHLVGSAEQSFIELILQGKLAPAQRYVAATPCFRDEIEDELHQNYFFKVELFKEHSDFSSAMTDTYNVVCFARDFYKKCFELDVSWVWDGTECDLILNGIEIGSYGARKFRDKFWTYGTGIAEPRFSQALGKIIK